MLVQIWMGLRMGAPAAQGSAGQQAIWERYRELQAGFFIELPPGKHPAAWHENCLAHR
jgi:hypothetical protein